MPQVPTYDGPQVGLKQLNYDQASPESFGAAQGRQMAQVGQGAMQLGNVLDAMNEREMQTQVFNAEAAAKADYVKWSQDQVKNRQGESAKGLTKDAGDWWGKAAQDYSRDLSPMAQRMLQKSIAQQSVAASQSMGSFENQQLEVAQQASLKATTQASRDSAVSDSSDTNIALQRQNIIAAWSTQAKKYDAATLDQLVKNDLTQMHTSVFNKLFVENPSQAKLYYEVNQKEITGQVKDDILARLKVGVAAEEGSAGARGVFAATMAGKGYNDAIPVDEMDAALVKQFSSEPEKLKAARGELDRQVALRNKAQSERNAGAIEGVYGLLNKNTPLAAVMRTPEWSTLSEQNQRQIQQQINDRNHMMWARSIEDKNRLQNQQELNTAPAVLLLSQPENLSKMTRDQIIGYMPEIGFNNTQRLLQTWQTYTTNQTKLSQATVDNDAFKSVLAGAGIEPSPKPTQKEAAKRVIDLRTQFELTIGDMQQNRKGELSATEKLKVMQDIVNAEVLRPGFWSNNYSKSERVIDLKPDQLLTAGVKVTDTQGKPLTFSLAQIPASEFGAWQKQLRREGKVGTPAEIAQAWYDFTQQKGKK